MAFGLFSSVTSVTLQNIVDDLNTFSDIEAVLNVGGFAAATMLSVANTVMQAIFSETTIPYKWNEFDIPPIYSSSFQQDYAQVYPAGLSGNLTLSSVNQVSIQQGIATYNGTITGGDFGGYVGVPFVVTGFVNSGNNGTFMCVASSAIQLVLKNTGAVVETHAGNAISAAGPITNLSWLQRGAAFDINNSSNPKPWVRIETGRSQSQASSQYTGAAGLGDPGFRANWMTVRSMYFGTWGSADVGGGTLGNNPKASSVYTQPLGNNSQPKNPITQIKDANGNFLLLTGYGTEGSGAPLATVNAVPGTTVSGAGATTVWTVLDPNSWGFRFLPVPSQTGTEWQFNLVAQMKPIRFVSLAQTIAPLPDHLETFFREGCIAQCYKRSPERATYAKFKDAWSAWLKALDAIRKSEDRELEEYKFIPSRTVFGAARSRNNFQGGSWPFNYPRP